MDWPHSEAVTENFVGFSQCLGRTPSYRGRDPRISLLKGMSAGVKEPGLPPTVPLR